jgi:hypothetical protein
MDPVTPAAPPIRYSLALDPAAWHRIRLDGHAEADVRVLLDQAFAGVPESEAAAAREQLAERFAAQIAAARARNGLDLYLPADPAHRHAGAVAVLAAQVVIPTSVPLDPAVLVAKVADGNPAARTGVIAGSAAVRIDNAGALDADGGEPAARRVEYIVAVPNDPEGRWLSVALTALPDAGTDVLVAEFDQVIATVQW